MAGYSNVGVNPNTTGARPSLGGGGGISTTDVRPAWESLDLWEWVSTWLIPMLVAGQSWPQASEAGVWEGAVAQKEAALALASSQDFAITAAHTIVSGWNAPPTQEFLRTCE